MLVSVDEHKACESKGRGPNPCGRAAFRSSPAAAGETAALIPNFAPSTDVFPPCHGVFFSLSRRARHARLSRSGGGHGSARVWMRQRDHGGLAAYRFGCGIGIGDLPVLNA